MVRTTQKIPFLLACVFLSAGIFSSCSNNQALSQGSQDPKQRTLAILGDENTTVILPGFPKTKVEVDAIEKEAIAVSKAAYDQVAGLRTEKLTFRDTFKSLDRADAAFTQFVQRINVVGDLGTTETLRNYCKASITRLEQYAAGIPLRSDVYAKLNAAASTFAGLNTYDAKLVEVYLRNFKKSGADKSGAVKIKIARIQKEISKAKEGFDNAVGTAGKEVLLLTKAEVDPLPDFIKKMIKDTESPAGYNVLKGNLNVWGAVGTYAENETLREKAWKNRNGFAKDRSSPFALVLANKRKELAKLLGYSSWLAFQADGRMAQNSENVNKMYAEVIPNLTPLKEKETEKFTQVKREITGDANATLKPWDLNYIEQKIKEKEFAFDPEKLRDYFPLAKVKTGIFEVYGKVFGIKFEKYLGTYDTWYPGVDLYRVLDVTTGDLLGVVYLDLFARAKDGKRTGAWMNQMIPPQVVEGKSFRPTVQVVANFRPQLADAADSYLSFDELNTFFHEFGHAMHSILGDVPHATVSMDGIEWDFVEAPSQIMEDFLSDYKVVALLSSHKESGVPLPLEDLQKINKSKNIMGGYYWSRQVAFGQLDIGLNGRDVNQPDLTLEEMLKISDDSLSQYWIEIPKGTGFVSVFSHINSGGYSAGYYSYIWAKIVAEDCGDQFKNSPEGYLNPEIGKKWRDLVLSKGSSDTAGSLVKNFLGRDYNSKAFIRSLQE